MNRDKHLFICSSPYTVFNSLNYVLNDMNGCRGRSDIILFHKTRAIGPISHNLKGLGVFTRVYDYRDFQKSVLLPAIGAFSVMFPRCLLKLLQFNGEDLPLSYSNLISQNHLFLMLFAKLNRGAACYLIEDGLGSYSGRAARADGRSALLRFFDLTICGGRSIPKCTKQFVYCPEMVMDGQIAPHRLLSARSVWLDTYKSVFGYVENRIYDEHPFVLLGDATMSEDIVAANGSLMTKYDVYYQFVVTTLPRNSSIYRAHPVETIIPNRIAELGVDAVRNLWELECLTQITDHHVLISFFSTAAASPKILYDKEPHLVFLFLLLHDRSHQISSMLEYVKNLRRLYSNPEKIVVVKDFADLECKLVELKGLQISHI